MAKNLVKLNINGTDYDQRPYAVCETPRDNIIKMVTIPDFTLVDGATIIVKFVNGFNGARSSLQVNSIIKSIFKNSTDSFMLSTSEAIMELKYDSSLNSGSGGWIVLNTNVLTQADWRVTDRYSPQFILNKPTIPTLPIWGEGLTYDSETNTLTGSTQHVLPNATTDELGGIKSYKNNAYTVAADVSSITSNITRTGTGYCGVELDSNDKAFVYVPKATESTNGLIRVAKVNSGTQTAYTNGTTAYGLEIDGNGKAFVKIPQIPTYSAATADTLGLVKVGDGLSITDDTGVLSVDSTQTLNTLTFSGDSHPNIRGNGELLSMGYSSSAVSQLVFLAGAIRRNTSDTTITFGTSDYPWPTIFSNTTKTGSIAFQGNDSDRILIRVDAGGATNPDTISNYGYTLKFLGSGTGINKALALYTDNLTATTQNLATKWLNDGTMYGRSILPHTTDTFDLGSSSLKWANVYATTFTGNATTATTATNANKVNINSTTANAYYPLTFITSNAAGNRELYIGGSTGTTSSSNGIRYNPSTNACYCSGGFYEASDERLKNFGDDIEVDLDKLSQLSKKYFTWKDDKSNAQQIGVSAQEIQKLYPELVNAIDEDGHLSVSYDKLSVVALKGIDILNDKVKSLEERLERLEKIING